MVAFAKMFPNLTIVNDVVIAALVLLLIPVTDGLNLGLIAGDLKRHSSPLVIKKVSKHAPVYININRLPTPKLLPPPSKLPEPKTKPSRKLPRSILSPFLIPPLVPKLPLLPLLPILPILPPILPPLIPKLPLLPILPPLPIIPGLKSPMKPLSVPILGKQKALGTELKPVKVPILKEDIKDDLLNKLRDLKKKGSLTLADYIKLRKLLLK